MPAELLARLQRLTLALGEARTHDDIARVVSAHGGDSGTEEHALVATLGAHAAKYLEVRHRLESIVAAAAALSKTLTRDDVAKAVIEHGMQLAGADTCTLYMLDESGSLALIGERGTAPEVVERIRRVPRTRDSLLFDQLNTTTSRFVETASDYAKLFPGLSAIASDARRAKAFWSVPLFVENRAMGLLGMGFYEERKFSRDERLFVEAFGQQCAQALLRAQHLIGDAFLAAVSHELRTPLNAIFGWARMLKGGSVTEERQQHGIEVIERNSIAMTQLIEDLLDVARIVSGKLRVDLQPVDLAEITASAIDAARPAAAARGVDLEVAIEPVGCRRRRPGPIAADRLEFAQQRREIHPARRSCSRFARTRGDARRHRRR